MGPLPRDPDDPDFWDWSDDVWALSPSDGDPSLLAHLARRRRRRRLVALLALVLLAVFVLVTAL